MLWCLRLCLGRRLTFRSRYVCFERLACFDRRTFHEQQLFDFTRIGLEPGQSKTVYFTNTVRSLSTVDKRLWRIDDACGA